MPRIRSHHPHARGRYFMQRGWQDHPVFADEPFTTREAWEWLIAEAFWHDGRTRAGNFVVTLKRGQLCGSVRYLANCWQWKLSKVNRFLKRLKTETMIDTHSETGINVITICNYDKFQRFVDDGGTATGTPAETTPKQHRNKIEEHQDNYTSKDSEESFSLFPAQTAPPAPRKKSNDPPYSTEFEAFWSAYPRHNGSKKEAFKAYQQKMKHGASHERIIAGAKQYLEAHRAKGGGTAYVKHAHRWLNNECWTIEYDTSVSAPGNAVSHPGTGASGYLDATQRILEKHHARATELEDAPHR